jgi:hypothetical protein
MANLYRAIFAIFNINLDVRACVDFATRAVSKEMKNDSGDWIGVIESPNLMDQRNGAFFNYSDFGHFHFIANVCPI